MSKKAPLLAFLALLTHSAAAQTNLFDTVRPDVMIIIREHKATGADLVQITTVQADYPKEQLRNQINRMAEILGVAPRGVTISTTAITGGQKMNFLRAEFAIDGLVEQDLPAVRLEAVLKAFAEGKEPHRVRGLNILLDDIVPSPKTVLKYAIPNVLNAEGRFIPAPRGIEYRIELLTDDPSKITFPEKIDKSNETTPETTSQTKDNRVLLISLFSIAGLALGALVYFAMLRGGSRKDSKKKR